MTPYQFGLLAGALAGLGAARFRHGPEAASRSGTVGLLAAAAGTAALTPAVGGPLSERVFDLAGLPGFAPVLGQLLLVVAAVAGGAHLLDRLDASGWVRYCVGLSAIATVVMLWQWISQSTLPAGTQADFRWFFVAFATALAVPQIGVLAAAIRYRGQHPAQWASILAAAATAGIAWCLCRGLVAGYAPAAEKIPGGALWVLAVTAGLGYWGGNLLARIDENQPAPEDTDSLDDEPDLEVSDEADVPELPAAGSARVINLGEARERATALATALSRQLADADRDTAVSVGVTGDDAYFCTADGLGFLPEGGAGADGLTPLIDAVPAEFIARWIGCAHPQMPLLAAAEQEHVEPFDAVATTGPGGNLDAEALEEAEAAVLDQPRSRTGAVPVSQAHAVFERLSREWDVDFTASRDVEAAVASARWTARPKDEYRGLWASELLLRAAEDLDSGDIDSARYELWCADQIPTLTAASIVPEAQAPARPAAPQPSRATLITAQIAKAAGTETSVAVAMDAAGNAVFATEQGLGYLPSGSQISENCTSLAMAANEAFLARWLGCRTPHVALLAAVDEGLIPAPSEILTTEDKLADPRAKKVTGGELAAALTVPAGPTVDRVRICAIDRADVDDAYRALVARFGFPADVPSTAWRAAQDQLWASEPSEGYLEAWGTYLVTAADAAIARADDSARYLLRNGLIVLSAAQRARV
ncbi:Uncharacterised protein (plasmid) [Tsukamurella tyrosinosolvens]|uniref:Uncharacterized protein n=1 Tax=Tsukamurella tyrosinosolvens TaxID=57704 RepID=A0A1H4UX59_TSUTY|nr:hypothetical protein [Tsukamurella tyrosinosolvens]KXO98411.1 hypothetical protein AXK58_25395 [Tsukamurella tyrosinosolvens]SEC73305.1 hypothetical protein SAMN04489793_3068 [Tsukamurella tyrosinosolvens]VEH90825.1 Uncharacterised protein [Tsukamurella tyrosinosolvens]